MAKKFRTKPVEKWAVQWTGDNVREMVAFAGTKVKIKAEGQRMALVIDTLEGVMVGKPMDWIICGIQGEFYPCKPDIFAANYEPADEPSTTGRNEMLRMHERYENDSAFHRLVDTMLAVILEGNFTPTEIREAAMLAQIRYEDIHIRPNTFTRDDVLRGKV